MTRTADLRAPWTVGSTPPTLPYKGEENDGSSFLVPWSATHSVNELLNLYNPRRLSPTLVIGDPGVFLPPLCHPRR